MATAPSYACLRQIDSAYIGRMYCRIGTHRIYTGQSCSHANNALAGASGGTGGGSLPERQMDSAVLPPCTHDRYDMSSEFITTVPQDRFILLELVIF